MFYNITKRNGEWLFLGRIRWKFFFIYGKNQHLNCKILTYVKQNKELFNDLLLSVVLARDLVCKRCRVCVVKGAVENGCGMVVRVRKV